MNALGIKKAAIRRLNFELGVQLNDVSGAKRANRVYVRMRNEWNAMMKK
jgi:hypothetical protein